MRYVKVPENIQLVPDDASDAKPDDKAIKPWPISLYLKNVVLRDPAMGTGYEITKTIDQVYNNFKDEIPGKFVGVEDAHWKLLVTTINDPKGSGIDPFILCQLLPFMDAILEAKDKKPTEANKK